MEKSPSGFDPEFHEEMAREAREEFPAFFAIASPAEASIMDAAFVGAHAYRQAVQTARPAPEHPVRHPLVIVTQPRGAAVAIRPRCVARNGGFQGVA